MQTCALYEDTLEAHGGRSRWQAVECIEASLSSGGFAFASKFQGSALHGLKIEVYPHARRVVLNNFCQPGWRGIWTADLVQIRDDNDTLFGERRKPRAQFQRMVKQIRWDKLDILYFAGYALWNYLSFPFLLDLPGVTVTDPQDHAQGLRRLEARFDPAVPTHSAIQSFHVNASCQLVRHDYIADVIGTWAKAANCCLASEQIAGLRFYTRRKVYPLMGRHMVLPLPTLVWIELDDLRVTNSQN